jgi:hypothetical protein
LPRLSCRIDPSAEADVFALDPSSPAVIEVWSRRLGGTAAPDLSLSTPEEGDLALTRVASSLGEDATFLVLPEAEDGAQVPTAVRPRA